MDTLNVLTNISIAALLILVGYLIFRQTLPILDRMATAITTHLGNIDRNIGEITMAVQQLVRLTEDEQHARGRDTGRQRGRTPPADDNRR